MNEEGHVRGAGAVTRDGKGVGAELETVDGAEGSGKVDEEGVEASGAAEIGGALDLLPLAFLGPPLNVTVGSSRFQ